MKEPETHAAGSQDGWSQEAGRVITTERASNRMECDTEPSLFLPTARMAPRVRVGPAEKQLDTLGWGEGSVLCGLRSWGSITFKKPCLKIGHGSFKHCGFGSYPTARCLALAKWGPMNQKCTFW